MSTLPRARSARVSAAVTAALALSALSVPSARAQTAPASRAPADAGLEEVVVTGTSIRGIAAVGSDTVSVTRADIEASGRDSPVDLVRELPQVQGLGFDDSPRVGQNGGGNIQRGRTVNIRGLGSNATLLLIDGNRVAPTGNVFSFTEADQLPVAAIERIDVIADGASAIYGSDAVAGVVNYITRKSFDGVEASARGTSTDGYSQWGGSLLGGVSWNGGGLVVAYDHDVRGEMRFGESPYLRQDLRRFGGPDTRVRTNTATSGTPGNIVVPRATNNPTIPTAGRFDYYGIPVGSTGVGVTAAQLLLNQPNLADQADYTSYLPDTTRDQVSLSLHQDFGERVSASLLSFYNHRESLLHNYPQSGVRTLPATSPFYVAGIPGVAPGARETVAFSLYKDIGMGEQHVLDQQLQVSGNVRAELGKGWAGQVLANYSRNSNCANCIDPLSNNINAAALQRALDNGTYNPFSSTAAPVDVLATFLPRGYDRNRSTLQEYTLRFDGPLFAMPGGDLKAAVGASRLKLTQWRTAVGIQATSDVPLANADRNITAFYGEVYVPIVGAAMNVPAVRALNLSLAVRTEDYSDVGRTTNPKIGVNWDIVDGVRIRGAWGRSFRAPNLIENNPAFFSRVSLVTIANAAGDPAIPVGNTGAGTSNVVQVAGSSTLVTPEKARNWSLGVELEPAALPGFKAALNYYDIQYRNQIIGLQGVSGTFLASPVQRALYSAYVIAAPQPVGCVNGNPATYNQAYRDALAQPSVAAVDQSNFCSAQAVTFSRNTNASTVEQNGLDLTLGYRLQALGSTWLFNVNATKMLKNDLQVVPGGPMTDALDILNQPISMRGRASITWQRGMFTVSPSVTTVGSYTNNLPITVNGVLQPVRKVPRWTTTDLLLAADLDTLGGMARGLRGSLTLRNAFDKDPPVVLSANGNAFDPQGANPFGRIFTLQLTKTF